MRAKKWYAHLLESSLSIDSHVCSSALTMAAMLSNSAEIWSPESHQSTMWTIVALRATKLARVLTSSVRSSKVNSFRLGARASCWSTKLHLELFLIMILESLIFSRVLRHVRMRSANWKKSPSSRIQSDSVKSLIFAANGQVMLSKSPEVMLPRPCHLLIPTTCRLLPLGSQIKRDLPRVSGGMLSLILSDLRVGSFEASPPHVDAKMRARVLIW
jgi:hypothetical protein